MARAKRAVRKPLWRHTVDSTASLCNACETLRKDAVDSTVRRRNGPRNARLRTPRAHQFSGAR
eukprot:7780078-Lingulodinium_polyedra.AAC.1